MDSIFTFLLENWKGAIWMLIGGAIIWVYLNVKFKSDKAKDQAIEAHKKIDNLPCEKHKEDISIVKQNGEKLDDITSSIRKIEEWIIRKDVKAMSDLVRKCSPYTLTDVGTIILSQSKAKRVVDNNIDYLVGLIESTTPKTAYDVEKNSLSVLTNILDEELFDDIKNFVYNSPEYIPVETSEGIQNIEIDMNRILMVMSIYLRDKYFEKHEEIDTKDFTFS